MSMSRRKRHEFRPNLGDGPLEERVVLSTITAPIVRTHESLLQNYRLNTMENALSGRQLRRTLQTQLRTAANAAETVINTQVRQLYANGRPTAQERADFNATVGGVLNATALRLSSLVSLLPGGAELAPRIQSSLIGQQPNSLVNRLDRLAQSNRITRSIQTLETAIGRQFDRVVTQRAGELNRFVRNNALNTAAVDDSGQVIPLRQYIGTQLINQLGNSLGSLSQSFSTMAGSSLFPEGTTTASPEALQAFGRQYSSALGLTGFQLGNGLSLLNGFTSGLTPQLQSALSNTGEGSTSLFSALQGLPTAFDGFNTAASTAFTNGFTNLTSPLSSFFNLPSTQTFELPTSNFQNPFGSQFSNFGNGFNSGFGTGFPGFGTPTSDFNTNFGTGFNNVVSGAAAIDRKSVV